MFLIHYLKIQDKVSSYLKLAVALFAIELIVRSIFILNASEADVSSIKMYTTIDGENNEIVWNKLTDDYKPITLIINKEGGYRIK